MMRHTLVTIAVAGPCTDWLRPYQRRRAAESRPEWCDMCDFEAANLSGMQLHMRMAHGVAA